MSSVSFAASKAEDSAQPDPRRWRALAVLGLIQFMLVLDTTVVNIALPRIQSDLAFTGPGLAWVVTGYVVMAGGTLLLGGRLADIYGRRKLFMIGVTLFAITSATCGAAVNPAMLVTSRFVQGVGLALATPASLGLIALLFPDMRERFKALGIWGGIAGIAGTIGPILSGVLVGFASWRWIFFINLPIAAYALWRTPKLVSESKMVREEGRLDLPGAVTATVGLVAIVYGLLSAASKSWVSPQVLVPLIGGIVLLAVMLVIEFRTRVPLIPPRFFTSRTRTTANAVTLLLAAAFFTLFYVLSLFTQQILHWSPLESGLSGLPFAVTITLGIVLSTKLLPRFGVKPVLIVGFLGSAAGTLMLSNISPETKYVTGLLPGLAILGLFYGSCFPATTNAAMNKVTGQDAGLASGVQTTMQQVGGALGLAALVTLAIQVAKGDIADGVAPAVAATNGYSLSLLVATGLLVVAALLVLFVMQNIKPMPRPSGPPPNQAAPAAS